MCNNQRHGLLVNTGQRLMLRNNVFANNKEYPMHVDGAKVRSIVNWESAQPYNVRTQDWTMIGNVVFSINRSLFTLPNWQHFFDTLYSNDNVWHARKTDKLFGLGREGNLTYLTLKDWRQQIKNDHDSHITMPINLSQPTCQ
ncbi:MAG: hypothetical protein NPIRA04_06310 [Nitrospirales bacterium]|nr:MAG: hypothetical protein NPIRA04_06310 [Nitrospirales bacterium]